MKLSITPILEQILVRAVWAHDDPDDVPGLLAYSRVLSEDDAPGVHLAVLQRSPRLSPDSASSRGAVPVLDKWKATGLEIEFTELALTCAVDGGHLSTIEWWRDSGLVRREHYPHDNDGVLPALGLEMSTPSVADLHAAVFTAAATVASGDMPNVQLMMTPIRMPDIHALNEAFASPTQAVQSLHLWGCTVDWPRFFAFKLPPTIIHLDFFSQWCVAPPNPDDVARWTWPPLLAAMGLRFHIGGPVFPLRTLPATLVELDVSRCKMDDALVLDLLSLLPHSLNALDLSENSLTGTGLTRAGPLLPPQLQSLRLASTKISTRTNELHLDWHFPLTLTKLVVSSCELNADAAHALARAIPSSLTSLDMQYCTLDDTAAHRALAAALPPTLEVLIMGNMALGHDALHEYTTRLPPSLRELNAPGNAFSESNMRELAAHMPAQLKELWLERTGITDTCTAVFVPALPRTLTVLCMSKNRGLTDTTACLLAEHLAPPNVERLYLYSCSISREGKEVMCRNIPATSVYC
ncbi:hypothetical protein H9P43_002478 [Blastocladiella emersonii ATCC 22665]|nr:hypothetical protein H9P43_002478 [Blastocladiella emersonii ATCC 22665]